MKKLVVVLLALAAIGTLAFADAGISMGGWGRTWVSVVSNDGTDSWVNSGPGWANGARVGVNFAGKSDNMGFNLNLDSNGGTFGVGDQAKIWAKLSDMVTIEVGKVQGDALRGKIGDTGDLLSQGAGGEDNIFQRFYPKSGILVNLRPVDGLYLGAAIDAGTNGANVKLSDAFKAIQVGAGYTIADVGLVRAQYIGSATSTAVKYQVAFAYTGMAGLKADVGATFGDSSAQSKVNAGVSWGQDALSASAKVDANFGGTGGAFNAGAYATFGYALAAPLNVGAELGFGGMKATTAGTDAKYVDLFPFVKLGYSNGYLKTGFEYKASLESGGKGSFNVPVQLEYWF